MTWTFKDRYNPDRKVIIDQDFPQLLKILEETFLDFKHYNSVSTPAQKELIRKKGIIFAKSIYIHTQISYCLGTHNCQEDHLYNYYCATVKKLLINVHPMFAMKKYADYISFIRNENKTTTEKPYKNHQHNHSKKSNIILFPLQ